jgi:hypothetical protein
MKKINQMKKLFYLLLLLISATAQAQIKVGNNPQTVNADAALEIEHTAKGVLITRVALTANNLPAPLSAFTAGMVVYNTATAGTGTNGVTPGFYYCDGTKWQRAVNSMPDQTVDVSGLGSGLTSPSDFAGATGFDPPMPTDDDVIYINTDDGTTWTYDVSQGMYVQYQALPTSPWYLAKGNTDAGTNKKGVIYRPGAVAIGSDNTPDASAQLDVNSTTAGFLPPRMTNAQMTAIASPADGLVVYCTDCSPRGLYNYDNSQPKWIPVGSNTLPDATFLSGSIACSGTGTAISGTYQAGTPMTAANTKTITINVVTAGKYSASTDVQNGVSFSVSGTLLSVGAGTKIILKASGTPLVGGPSQTFTYTVTLAGQVCTFPITFASPANFNCSGMRKTDLTPLTDVLVNGVIYDATIKLPYTAGNGTAYDAGTPVTVNGLKLTRTPGTYLAAGDSVTYNIHGTYTGATGPNAVTFNLADGGCTVQFTGLQYSVVVNAATDVTFDGIKAMLPASGNRSLQFGAVTGTIPIEYNTYQEDGNSNHGSPNKTGTLTTTYAYINSVFALPAAGNYQFAYVRNTANNRMYKINLVIGNAYANNLIRFERVDVAPGAGSISASTVATGVVNSGVPVSLDNIKIQVATTGSRTLQISTVAGPGTAHWGSYAQWNGGASFGSAFTSQALTTSWGYIQSSFGNGGQDNYQRTYLYDVTNNKYYLLEFWTGAGYNNNLVRIERLDVATALRKGQVTSQGGSVTLNNLKVNIPTTNRYQQIATTSGSISAATYGQSIWWGGYSFISVPSVTISTTPGILGTTSSDFNAINKNSSSWIYDSVAKVYYRSLFAGAPAGASYFMNMIERW